MCGIAGILNRDGAPIDAAVLQEMTDAIAHRGPDGEGVHTDGELGLGNRRLAVIDLDPRASQPMATADGRFTITYNGELYNFRELGAELRGLGHELRTRGDTEVVLHAFAEWGPTCVERLNGMFAFAVWDAVRRELLLVRDRYGVKPLYYVQLGAAFLFASEVKSFLRHPGFRPELSVPHLLEYLTFQNVFSDGTLFDGVRLLPPGHVLRVSAEGIEQRRYWDFAFGAPESGTSDEEYAEELDRLFQRAVTRQLVSDVPVGSYLSGGIDSASITAVAAAELPYVSTFTVGFDLRSASGLETTFDERSRAEYMSYLFRTEHYEAVLKSGDMERCLPELVWHLEDLRVGQSYPNYYVSRLASKFVKVVLSGVGGDELFAGYPWRYDVQGRNGGFGGFVDRTHDRWRRLVPDCPAGELLAPALRSQAIDPRAAVAAVFPAAPALRTLDDFVNASLYFEVKTFLHGLFVVEDKLSMAHSLESRVPFLDNDLVDFAQRLPVRLKLAPGRNGAPGGSDGKQLLRRTLARYVPEEATTHAKQGFSGPDASWFRGESIDYVRRILGADDAHLFEFLDREAVHRVVDDHLEGRHNRRLALWSLLSLEHWCRIFLAGERSAAR